MHLTRFRELIVDVPIVPDTPGHSRSRIIKIISFYLKFWTWFIWFKLQSWLTLNWKAVQFFYESHLYIKHADRLIYLLIKKFILYYEPNGIFPENKKYRAASGFTTNMDSTKISFTHRYTRKKFCLQLLHLLIVYSRAYSLFTRCKTNFYHVWRWVNKTLAWFPVANPLNRFTKSTNL